MLFPNWRKGPAYLRSAGELADGQLMLVGEGTPIDLLRIPALWARYQDLPLDEAGLVTRVERWGMLCEVEESTHVRDVVHMVELLRTVAGWWKADPFLFPDLFLLPRVHFDREQIDEHFAVLNEGAQFALEHKGFEVRVDRGCPHHVPRSLLGLLWAQAAQAYDHCHRFKRCEACNEWFPVFRTGAKTCSQACRDRLKQRAA